MYQQNKNNYLTGEPNWIQTLDGLKRQTANELNCMRIGIVQNVYYDDLTVDVLIVNKKTLSLNTDGTQNVQDFPIIRAKIVYCNPFITCPINPGDECVILFSDREIESWFINGGVNAEGYPRMHALTDAVAIFGIRSLPQMITTLTDALHLFYGATEIILKQTQTDINSSVLNVTAPDINVTGNTVQTGDITATNLNATAAFTGTFRSYDYSKTVKVVNGIIVSVT